jgi:DNA-binding response OmpR family regulator
MDILLVEPDDAVVEVLSAAAERARPGTRLGFAADLNTASKVLRESQRDAKPLPMLVVLGPDALALATPAAVAALRAALPVPVLALAARAADAARARTAGLDAVYRYRLDWQLVSGEVRQMMTDWFHQGGHGHPDK